MMRLTMLLPHLAGLRVLKVILSEDMVALDTKPRATTARCPACRRRSSSVHSQYVRHIADQPIGGRRVTIRLRVRRCRRRPPPGPPPPIAPANPPSVGPPSARPGAPPAPPRGTGAGG